MSIKPEIKLVFAVLLIVGIAFIPAGVFGQEPDETADSAISGIPAFGADGGSLELTSTDLVQVREDEMYADFLYDAQDYLDFDYFLPYIDIMEIESIVEFTHIASNQQPPAKQAVCG